MKPTSGNAGSAAHPGSSFLQACSVIASACLQRHGLDRGRVAAITEDIVGALRRDYGGTMVYIGRRAASADDRAAEVRQLERQGLSMREIAQRLDITQQYAYALRARITTSPIAGRTRRIPKEQ